MTRAWRPAGRSPTASARRIKPGRPPVTEIVDKFGEISGTFFFKTMPSVPAARACQRDAASLVELRNAGDWTSFEPALEQFIKSAQSLIEKAGMKGTTLT